MHTAPRIDVDAIHASHERARGTMLYEPAIAEPSTLR
jgi:hypothetical protein